ncbi:MAG TPA: hypothetical protein DD649_03165 [Providencia sp.]|uniref:hypothetical protein n=1 Tax=unclassified Providencia TaxID=2633465 RepID=UPI000E8F1AE9|nr:hypothetical protein [Providencia sp.]MBP6082488.1 hypothetical protein [Providencia sp.]HBO21874.1 hypothetical protein [Providencia sp.]
MKKILLGASFLLCTFGVLAEKNYTVEQLHEMIAAKHYPEIKEYKVSGSGDMPDIDACKQRLEERSGDFAQYPRTVEQDTVNVKYEITTWMLNKAQKVICEMKDGKAEVVQLDAEYK